MKQAIIDFYLDWVNNYITLAKIAEHYNISENDALLLISMGKKWIESK